MKMKEQHKDNYWKKGNVDGTYFVRNIQKQL